MNCAVMSAGTIRIFEFGEENGDSRVIVSSLRASASCPARAAAIGAGTGSSGSTGRFALAASLAFFIASTRAIDVGVVALDLGANATLRGVRCHGVGQLDFACGRSRVDRSAGIGARLRGPCS